MHDIISAAECVSHCLGGADAFYCPGRFLWLKLKSWQQCNLENKAGLGIALTFRNWFSKSWTWKGVNVRFKCDLNPGLGRTWAIFTTFDDNFNGGTMFLQFWNVKKCLVILIKSLLEMYLCVLRKPSNNLCRRIK